MTKAVVAIYDSVFDRDQVITMSQSNYRPVYSTDRGSLCPDCGAPKHPGKCRNEAAPRGDGKVRIQRQTKGRKGKGVTCISGLPLADTELKTLAKQLKKSCGSGGTVKDGVIEIQGDYKERLLQELTKLGYNAVIAGG